MTEITYRVNLLDESGEDMLLNTVYDVPVDGVLADHWQAIREQAKDELTDTDGLTLATIWLVSVENLATGEVFQPEDEDQPEWPDPSQSHMRID